MSKQLLIIISVAVVAILALAGYLIWKDNQPQEPDNEIILFYRDGCPHCENVDNYIEENNIEEKITFSRKDAQQNSGLFRQKAKICNIPESRLGVPFLWNGPDTACFMGADQIINFFESKTNE